MILLYISLVLSQLRMIDVVMDEKREKRKINCGTEKGKHKSKNKRTVGTTTFKTKVLIVNADTEKGLFYGFQQ